MPLMSDHTGLPSCKQPRRVAGSVLGLLGVSWTFLTALCAAAMPACSLARTYPCRLVKSKFRSRQARGQLRPSTVVLPECLKYRIQTHLRFKCPGVAVLHCTII